MKEEKVDDGAVKEPPAIDEDSEKPTEKQDFGTPKEIKLKPRHLDEGFFNDFEKFMNNRGMNEDFISELLDKDLLHKMRQFHTQREEGAPFFFHTEDSDRELAQKLEELKILEEEWYIRHRNLKEAEMLLLKKEAEIDLRLEGLKTVLKHIKQREKLERKADKDNYFNLEDGRALRSVGELREALKTMNEKVFNSHVTEKRNDFAIWVEHVFSEPELAGKMRSSSSRKELLDILYDF